MWTNQIFSISHCLSTVFDGILTDSNVKEIQKKAQHRKMLMLLSIFLLCLLGAMALLHKLLHKIAAPNLGVCKLLWSNHCCTVK